MADRYTTPTITLEVTGVNLTGMTAVLTLKQGSRTLNIPSADFTRFDISGNTASIDVTLTQGQSAMFLEDRDVEMQLNYVDANGFRGDTDIATISFGRNLHEEVIEHG